MKRTIFAKFLNKTSFRNLVFPIVIFLIVFLGSVYKVEERVNNDEWLWVPIGIRFVDSLGDAHLSSRPGVSISWISGTTTRIALAAGQTTVTSTGKDVYIDKRGYILNRIVFAFVFSVLSVALYFLIKRLIGWKKAALVSILIATHPLVLLKSETVWTDLMLAFSMLLSLTSYMVFVKEGKKKFLYLAGALFGLTVSTKTIGAGLLPVFLIGPILYKKEKLKDALIYTVIVGAIGFGIFFLIYPYLWHSPSGYTDRYKELAAEVSQKTEVLANSSLLYYPRAFLNIDPVTSVFSFFLLIPTIFLYLKRKVLPISAIFIPVIITLYMGVLVLVSQFSYFWGPKISSNRYLIPIVFFSSLFLVEITDRLAEKNLKFLRFVPYLALAINLYNLAFLFPCDFSSC